MAFQELPDDQAITYRISPKEGSLFRARLLGGQLEALADLMKALGDKDTTEVETFVAGIEMHEDGSIEFKLAVLPYVELEED